MREGGRDVHWETEGHFELVARGTAAAVGGEGQRHCAGSWEVCGPQKRTEV
jgi:hypothetical protein